MNRQDVENLKRAALALSDAVTAAASLPLLARAAKASELSATAAALIVRLAGAVEVLSMRLTALEFETGKSTIEVKHGQ